MKIRSMGAMFFHTNRQTDKHEEANSCFSQFCESAWTVWNRAVFLLCSMKLHVSV